MIEILGLLYGLGKDLQRYFEWEIEDKLVDGQWLDLSGFKDHMEREGVECIRPDSGTAGMRLLSKLAVVTVAMDGALVARADLIDRGNGLIYDDVLDIRSGPH